jgi:hypothetical protein
MLQRLVAVREFPGDIVVKVEFRADADSMVDIIVRDRRYPIRQLAQGGGFKRSDWNSLVVTVTNNIARVQLNGQDAGRTAPVIDRGLMGIGANRGAAEFRHFQVKPAR